MNKLFPVLLFLLCFTAFRSHAQDLIVSNEGDSLNCTVVVKNLKSIHFFYKEDNEIITRELPVELFKTVIIGFYKNSQHKKQIVADSVLESNSVSTRNIENVGVDSISVTNAASATVVNEEPAPLPVPGEGLTQAMAMNEQPSSISVAVTQAPDSVTAVGRWYFGARAGYANRLFRTGNKFPADYANYLKKLKSGYTVGLGAGYYFWRNVGLGLTGEIYKSTARMEDESRDDAVSIKYIGPSIYHRKLSQNKKRAVQTAFSLGYQTFSNAGQESGNPFRLSGHTLGWGGSVGVDFRISPQAAIGLSASCLIGTLYKLTKDSGGQRQTIKLTSDQFEQLSRFALTVELKFL